MSHSSGSLPDVLGSESADENLVVSPEAPHKRRRTSPPVANDKQHLLNSSPLSSRVVDLTPQSPLSPSGESIPETRLKSESSNSDSFRPGSIMSMRLRNFQVFVDATFHFGPRMNMIVAPNGSGKSTVVTAIFVIFGGKYERSESAKTLGDYIRRGTDFAIVDVTLKGHPGGPDPQITLKLKREVAKITPSGQRPVKAQYIIDGRTVQEHERDVLIAKYSIQVNNLSQFLRQERVGAFSAESSQQRLRSTEEAVGSAELLKDHDDLVSLGPQLAAAADVHARQAEQAEKLRASIRKNTELLARLDEHRDNEQRVKQLKSVRPLKQWLVYKDQVTEAKAARAAAASEVNRINRECSTLETKANEIKARTSQLEIDKASMQARIQNPSESIKSQLIDLGEHTKQLKRAIARSKSLMAEREGRDEEEETIRSTVSEASILMERKRANCPSDAAVEDASRLRERTSRELHAASVQQQTLASKLMESQTSRSKVRSAVAETRRIVENTNADRERIDKATYGYDSQKYRVSTAMRIYKDMKPQFRGKTFPPPMLSMKLAAGLGEAHYRILSNSSFGDSLAKFTCELREDYEALSRALDKQGVNTGVIALNAKSRMTVSDFRRPASPGELARLGLEGYIIDLVEGPELVKVMLCVSNNLHRMAYSTKRVDIRKIQQSGIPRIVDSVGVTSIRESKYGSRQTQLYTEQLGPRKPYIDALLLESAEQGDARARQRLQELEAQLKALEADTERLNAQKESFATELARLKAADSEAMTAHRALVGQRREAAEARRFYENKVNEFNKVRAERRKDSERAEVHLKEVDKKLASLKSTFGPAMSDLVAAHQELVRVQLSILTNQSMIKRIENGVAAAKEPIIAAHAAADAELVRVNTELDDFAKRVIKPIRQKLGISAFKEAVEAAATMSLEEIDNEIEQREIQMSLNETGQNYATVKQTVRKEQQELDDISGELERQTSSLGELTAKVNQVRGRWEARLDELIDTVSAQYSLMFARLGYEGRVELVKEEDYANWGLDILVSFRHGEPLRALSARRQSGGERAVSTAVYLLSLQGLTQVPFSVVDEINQGMDEFNESNVHRFVVQKSSDASTRQYFLITPKLLMDLHYSVDMKIHTIFGGPGALNSKSRPDLKRLRSRMLQGA